MVLDFLKAIFSQWLGLMGGALATLAGVIAAIISLRGGNSDRTTLWVMFWVGLICLFVLSPFLVWQDERISNLDARRQLDELANPKFIGGIGQLAAGFIADEPNPLLCIFTTVSVTNLGAPSVVGGWRVWIETPDGVRHQLSLWVYKQPLTISGIEFKAADLIVTKAALPITKGDRRKGILLAKINEADRDVISQKTLALTGNSLIVSFEDVLGHRTEVKAPFSGGSPDNKLLWDPGAFDVSR